MEDVYSHLVMAEVTARRERLRYDNLFRMELVVCQEYRIPHSEFLSWSLDDRAKAMALMLLKSEECALCGTHPEEWAADTDAYVAEPHWCPGCFRKDAARDPDAMQGTTVNLKKNTETLRAKRYVAMMKEVARKKADANESASD